MGTTDVDIPQSKNVAEKSLFCAALMLGWYIYQLNARPSNQNAKINRTAGPMARRLTSNQKIVGSIPAQFRDLGWERGETRSGLLLIPTSLLSLEAQSWSFHLFVTSFF
ncbi:hypothetical protein B0O99DRAFT_625520 [Bisporella sp. PMI_857]|nr:hypothetical protein B0O99DRAFT_625520 [Bisporella sp. PMI_857]